MSSQAAARQDVPPLPKIALDRDVVRAYLRLDDTGAAWDALTELIQVGATFWVVPTIAAELDTAGEGASLRWRDAPLSVVDPDDFLRGCATAMSKRYLDYHPDPRDCRVVAEAECAKMDAFLTLDADLVRGLGGRAENLRIEWPWEAAARITRLPDVNENGL